MKFSAGRAKPYDRAALAAFSLTVSYHKPILWISEKHASPDSSEHRSQTFPA